MPGLQEQIQYFRSRECFMASDKIPEVAWYVWSLFEDGSSNPTLLQASFIATQQLHPMVPVPAALAKLLNPS